MRYTSEDIVVVVIAGTLLFLLLAGFILAFLFLSEKRRRAHQRKLLEVEQTYQRELLQAQIEVQEQTLQHISQELHDNIGQILSLVKINLTQVDVREEEKAREKIGTTRSLVVKALEDLRSLSKTLNADYVLRSQLSEALRFELDYIRQVCGCETALTVTGIERVLTPQQQIVVFRIAQEALNNAVKYAAPRNIRVELAYGESSFRLQVKDDGTGFDTESATSSGVYEKGSGLANMKTRAAMIGAKYSLQSLPGLGTSVKVEL